MKKKIIIISAVVVFLVAAGISTAAFLKNRQNEILPDMDEYVYETKNLKDAKLTFCFEAAQQESMQEILDQVEQKAKNLKIQLAFNCIWEAPEAYLGQVKSMIAAGQPCDAFYFSKELSEDLKSLAGENIIKDLTDILPEYAPNYYKQLSNEEIAAASADGKIYAVPNHYLSTQMRCAIVREDLMKKYDIPDIKSYDDYEVYLKTIKEKEPDMIPMTFWETAIGLFAEANGYVILDYANGLVYKWDDPDMKIVAWEQTPEFRKGIETIKRWNTNGYLLKGAAIAQIDDTCITSGKWGSFISTLGSDIDYNSVLRKNGISWRYKAYPLYPDKVAVRDAPYYGFMAVSATSANPERVVMFLDWLQKDQENYDSLMYGIKGKNYTLEGNRIDIPKGVTEENSYTSWYWRWPLTNANYERADVSNSEEAVKEYKKTILEKTKYAPHVGFTPDYKSLENITTLRNTTYFRTEQKVYMGELTDADIDAYIEEQKTNGIGELVAAVQNQLDLWRAANK